MTYDFNSTRTRRQTFSEAVNAHIDAALAGQQALEEPRAYNVSPSLVGDDCLRRIQYETTRAPGKPHEPKLLRIFDRGHMAEEMLLRWMRAAGFVISGAGPDGRQHGFSVANGQIRGRLDGIVLDGPEIEGIIYPCIWEAKALGAKGWRSVDKDGVAKAYPRYAAQIALYQAYKDIANPSLFTALNSDTMEIYHEAVAFDTETAQAASDRAVNILQANALGELLPRVAGDPDGFQCKWCRFNAHCWNDGELGPVRGGAK